MVKVKLLRYTRGGIGLIAGSARVSGIPPSLNSRKAVRMMVENDYGSVLEHVYFTFDISEMSIALSRELLEHRIASHTARSTRYHVEEGFGYVTPQPLKRSRRLTKLFRQPFIVAVLGGNIFTSGEFYSCVPGCGLSSVFVVPKVSNPFVVEAAYNFFSIVG